MREGLAFNPERGDKDTPLYLGSLSCVAQDRMDMLVPTCILPQQMSNSAEGTDVGVKRAIRFLYVCPVTDLSFGARDEIGLVRVWTCSDWEGDNNSKWVCRGRWLELDMNLVCHRSQLQSNVALSPEKRS